MTVPPLPTEFVRSASWTVTMTLLPVGMDRRRVQQQHPVTPRGSAGRTARRPGTHRAFQLWV